MRMDWRLVLGCLASIVVASGCDDGATVGGVGGTQGSSGNPASSSGSSGSSGAPTATPPPGVPDGAEIGEVADWFNHPAATYATFEADGKTVKDFGMVLPMASLASIPPGAFMSYQWFKVPQSVMDQTYIKSFELDFMPMGHPPVKIYDVPHVETHAFAWSQDEMSKLTCQGADDQVIPPQEFLPQGAWDFSPVPGFPTCLPQMGVHGFDANAPENNGARFTYSLTVLAARGEFVSFEPKATVEFFQQRKDFTTNLPKPQKVKQATKVPTQYVATYMPAIDSYRLEYTGFVTMAPN